MPRKQIEEVILSEALLLQLKYAHTNSPFYRQKLGKGFTVASLKTTGDFAELPFTTKDDIAKDNWSFLAVDRNEVLDFASTSGTLGKAVANFLTESDLQRLAINEKGSFQIGGCSNTDTIQLTTTMDKQFMAGLAYHYGARALGASFIRTGPGVLAMQWKNILDFKPTVLIAVPSFVPMLIKYAQSNGISINDCSVQKIICIGEPVWNKEMKLGAIAKQIKEQWNVELISTYACTEMATAFTACSEFSGVHSQQHLIYTEVVNEKGQQVKNGEIGEVVVTPLGVQGMPLIRFKTGDLCQYFEDKCNCNREGLRLGPVLGRQQQMLKIKGTTLFPNMVFDVLNGIKAVKSFYLEIDTDDLANDTLRIFCHCSEKEQVEIKQRLQAGLRVSPEVVFVDRDFIYNKRFANQSRKPILIKDLRKK